MPSESTCSFNPASLTGTGMTNIALNTTGPHPLASSVRPSLRGQLLAAALTAPFAIVFLIGHSRRGTWRRLMLCLTLGILFLGTGCGGSGSTNSGGGGSGGGGTDPGTPAGSYPITVTATSGTGSAAITHT